MVYDKRLEFLYAHGPPHRAREPRVIRTGLPGLRLRFYPGVPADARSELKAFARWLRREVQFRHPVLVTVVPHATVMGHEGVAGWAVFVIPPADHAPEDVVRIYVGAGAMRVMEKVYGYGRSAALAKVLHDLAHEVVHYEQWRDGRPVTERGVNRRAAALVRRYAASKPGLAQAVAAA